jgi:pentatricopeptide repeat protein
MHRLFFDKMSRRNTVSWNAMIVGYAMHGQGKVALQFFELMQQSGQKPNYVTFIGVLSACCHAGLVDDGWRYFDSMIQYYGITPTMDHYCCMVDLLGRAGRLDEAKEFIDKIPIKPNVVILGSLLGACRVHNNIKIGEHVAECLIELEPKIPAHYVQLSNIYAAVGRWDGIEKVRKLMKERNVKKEPGCSWIEINNKITTFLSETDHTHRWKKFMQNWRHCQGRWKLQGTSLIQNVCYMMLKRSRRNICFFSTVKSWQLHLDLLIHHQGHPFEL